MLPELKQLIRLQQIDDSVAAAQKTIDGFPTKSEALNARIEKRATTLESIEQQFTEHKAARHAVEKDAAQVQTRLTRFKEQLMEVKTNKEYHAVQVEIANADTEIKRLEDHILECMLQGDELSDIVTEAKHALTAEQSRVSDERATLEAERNALQAQVDQHVIERETVIAGISLETMALFNTLSRGRNGIAVAEARDGRCSVCQVRLRPQFYNELRHNTSLRQCESCQRILYSSPKSDVVTESP